MLAYNVLALGFFRIGIKLSASAFYQRSADFPSSGVTQEVKTHSLTSSFVEQDIPPLAVQKLQRNRKKPPKGPRYRDQNTRRYRKIVKTAVSAIPVDDSPMVSMHRERINKGGPIDESDNKLQVTCIS